MPKYVIERELPGAGQLSADELHAISGKSNAVLAGMAPRAQWLHSYVTTDKVYCVYVADDEATVLRARRERRLPGQRDQQGVDASSTRSPGSEPAGPRAATPARGHDHVRPRLNRLS